jgi:hypothetical protein
MDYKIAIRSYKRSHLIGNMTLKVLEYNNISKEKINVFVADEEEKLLYEKAIGDRVNSIIVGKLGGWQQTIFIQEYYPLGTPILFLDDDLENFYEFCGGKEKEHFLKTSNNLEKYILDGFSTIKQLGLKTSFTFKGMTNQFYLKTKSWKEFRPGACAGGFWGCYNDDIFKVYNYSHGDDVIRSANIIEECGGMISYNWCSFNTKIGTNEGGMQLSGDRNNSTESRKDFTFRQCNEIIKNIPNVKKYFHTDFVLDENKNNIYEFKMKNKSQIFKIRYFPNYKWENYFDSEYTNKNSKNCLF